MTATTEPKPPKNTGRSFEALVATIERAMTGRDDWQIETNKRITDVASKGRREFDILLTTGVGRHKVVTAIECRDYKRPVNVDRIDAFDTKCRDTLINNKIMVAANGFTKQAVEKARIKDIRLMTLLEADHFQWGFEFVGATTRFENLGEVDIGLGFAAPPLPVKPYTVFYDKDRILDTALASQLLRAARPAEGLAVGVHQVTWTEAPTLAFVRDKLGATKRLVRLILSAEYEISEQHDAASFYSYEGEGERVELAHGQIAAAGFEASFTLIARPKIGDTDD